MPRHVVKLVALPFALLFWTALAGGEPPANPKSPPAKGASTQPSPEKDLTAGLEEMLAAALRNNPDIRVAEAKMREAEAELNRTRLQVMQKVITFRHSVATQKMTVLEAEERLKTQQKLRAGSLTTEEELRVAQLAVEQAKSKLATLEAEMPSLLGKLPQSVAPEKKQAEPSKTGAKGGGQPNLSQVIDLGAEVQWSQAFNPYPYITADFLQPYVVGNLVFPNTVNVPYTNYPWNTNLIDANGTLFRSLSAYNANGWVAPVQVAPPQSARGALADKIRHALDTSVSLDIKDKSLAEVLKLIQQKAPGVPFHTVLPASGDFSQAKVTLQLEQVPLGAVLQALEDSFPDQRNVGGHDGMRLAVREYGILVTVSRMLPAGATLLHDFWKGAGDKKTAAGGGPHPSASQTGKNPPPAQLEGEVKSIDDGGLVVITIGADAGLSKGQSLEVYRVKPEPMYLGTLQIVQVNPKEAVGKSTATRGRGSIRVGDRVTSQVPSEH
jgi:hypothetical protein